MSFGGYVYEGDPLYIVDTAKGAAWLPYAYQSSLDAMFDLQQHLEYERGLPARMRLLSQDVGQAIKVVADALRPKGV